MDMPSSTKKLKEMKALIDSNLSPIKADPNEDHGDFKLKVQPVVGGSQKIEKNEASFDEENNFPTPKKDAPPKYSPNSPEAKYKAKKKSQVGDLLKSEQLTGIDPILDDFKKE